MKAIFNNFEGRAAEQSMAEKAHERLYFYLNRAKLTLDRLAAIEGKTPYTVADQKEIDRFETWFGSIKDHDTHISHVKNVIDAIHKRFEDDNIILVYDVKVENQGVYAFVTSDDIYKSKLMIHLCNEFFEPENPAERFDTRLGTILHELTHIIGFTEDFVYGEDECRMMCKALTIFNADSYEMYIESFRNM